MLSYQSLNFPHPILLINEFQSMQPHASVFNDLKDPLQDDYHTEAKIVTTIEFTIIMTL